MFPIRNFLLIWGKMAANLKLHCWLVDEFFAGVFTRASVNNSSEIKSAPDALNNKNSGLAAL